MAKTMLPILTNYAFFQSCEYLRIFGKKKKEADGRDIYGYVKICACDKYCCRRTRRCIYLRYYGKSIGANKIQLSYGNLCRLKRVDSKQRMPQGLRQEITLVSILLVPW